MKSFNVYITYKNGNEEQTRVCGKNYYDAANVARDFIHDSNMSTQQVSTILFEQCYDADDHAEYGDDYEW